MHFLCIDAIIFPLNRYILAIRASVSTNHRKWLTTGFKKKAVVANFFGMALGVQRALEKDPDDAKKSMKASLSGRMLGLFIVAVLGVVLPCFDTLAVLIPLLFPRIAIAIRPLWDRKTQVKEGENEG